MDAERDVVLGSPVGCGKAALELESDHTEE
jgi:hypothetical protein